MTQEAPSTTSRPVTGARFYARVLRYFMPDWPFVLLTFIFILLSTLAALLQPFPLAILIDSMESRQRFRALMTPDDARDRTVGAELVEEAGDAGHQTFAIRQSINRTARGSMGRRGAGNHHNSYRVW